MTVNNVLTLDISTASVTNPLSVEKNKSKSFEQTINNLSKKNDNNISSNPKKVNNYTHDKQSTKQISVKNDNIKQEDYIDDKVSKIEDFIKDDLNLTEEEYLYIMQKLGFLPHDLLNINNFLKVFLVTKQIDDIAEVFTNYEASNNILRLIEEYNLIVDDEVKVFVEKETFAKDDISLSNEKESFKQTSFKVDVKDDKLYNDKVNHENKKVEILNENQSMQNNLYDDKEDTLDENIDFAWDNITNNIVINKAETDFNISEVNNERIQVREIINQIVDKIKLSIGIEVKEMQLQLNPENLGRVNLTVSERNGQITANFIVENQMTKEAIESQIGLLVNALNEQGLKVEAMEVTLANYEFFNNSQESFSETENQNRNSNKKTTGNTFVESMKDDEELEEYDGISGVNVNYKA